MYNQVEVAILKRGNAVKYHEPVHKNKNGDIVEESLAFGLPVTIDNITYMAIL